jgi:rod shape-determining protein MreC
VRKSRGYTIWLVILLSLMIAGLALARTGHLRAIEGGFYRFTAPVQEQFGAMGRSIAELFQTFRDLRDLRQQNEQLTELANQLAVENVRLKELQAENEVLRRLVNFAESSASGEFKAAEVRARVVGYEPNSLLQYIIIAAGSDDGIAVGMPVVTERGLVGRVEQIYPTAARVRLIIDSDSSVNALVQRTRAPGIIKGQLGGALLLDYVPQGEGAVALGDWILTSGLGGGFPRQIYIGQVTDLQRKEYEMFQRAQVRPAVDFSRLEIVLVITNFIPLKPEELETGRADLATPEATPARP